MLQYSGSAYTFVVRFRESLELWRLRDDEWIIILKCPAKRNAEGSSDQLTEKQNNKTWPSNLWIKENITCIPKNSEHKRTPGFEKYIVSIVSVIVNQRWFFLAEEDICQEFFNKRFGNDEWRERFRL